VRTASIITATVEQDVPLKLQSTSTGLHGAISQNAVIIVLCCDDNTKHVNILCGCNAELLNSKAGGTYNHQLALNC
jgi:hypothetical protein